MNRQYLPVVSEQIAGAVAQALREEPLYTIARAEQTMREHDAAFYHQVYTALRNIRAQYNTPVRQLLHLNKSGSSRASARAVQDIACGVGVAYVYECLVRAWHEDVRHNDTFGVLPSYETFADVAQYHEEHDMIAYDLMERRNRAMAGKVSILAAFYGAPIIIAGVQHAYGVLSLCQETLLMVNPN